MLVIGLAGGSGSGKGTAAEIFASYGILPIDTDKVYHRLTNAPSECLRELTGEFGTAILTSDGVLDRARLAELVFGSEEKRKRLNLISHRHILGTVREIIGKAKAQGYFAVLVDAPLLFESGFDKECDLVVSVLADRETRISRIIARDGITMEKAEARINKQMPDGRLAELSDYVIENNGSRSELSARIAEIIEKIKPKG